MHSITINLFGKKPPTKHRPRFNGHAYKEKADRIWEQIIRDEWYSKYGSEKLDGYLYLEVIAYFPFNSRDTIKTKENKRLGLLRPDKKPDCDNTLKLVADALNGVAYKDDAQITTMYCTKRYADKSRLEVYIKSDVEEMKDEKREDFYN